MKDKYADYNMFWLTFELMLRMKPRLIESAVKHKLTAQQLHVLGFLSDKQPHPMSWLAALLSCDASNVTGIIDRLVALQLVERTESKQDRRVKMVQLTEKGHALRDVIMDELSKQSQERVDLMLSREEQEVFRKIVIKLLRITEQEAMAECPAAKLCN
ncbi:MAG: MarR family winged helix-turn-helix transcriptional regulator [Candidatus Saccharibacteria bacterium]